MYSLSPFYSETFRLEYFDRVKADVTYHEVSHILDESGGKNVQEALYVEINQFRQVYQLVVLGKKARSNDAEQTSQKEYKCALSLPRRRLSGIEHQLKALAGLDRAIVA